MELNFSGSRFHQPYGMISDPLDTPIPVAAVIVEWR
jgi:hypothetical protein